MDSLTALRDLCKVYTNEINQTHSILSSIEAELARSEADPQKALATIRKILDTRLREVYATAGYEPKIGDMKTTESFLVLKDASFGILK